MAINVVRKVRTSANILPLRRSVDLGRARKKKFRMGRGKNVGQVRVVKVKTVPVVNK